MMCEKSPIFAEIMKLITTFRLLSLCLLCLSFMGLTACSEHTEHLEPAPPQPAVTDVSLTMADTVFTDGSIGREGETMEHTLIIYMAAENSMGSFVKSDLREMAQSLDSIPADSRVVVFIDDQLSSRIGVATRGKPFLPVERFEQNINATDSSDMEAVLSTILRRFPARHYSLTLWSHASGWVFANPSHAKAPRRSFGIDNGQRSTSNSGNRLNITTLASILSHYPRMEYIFFDACFMQCAEVAYELRHATPYVIASAAEIPGDGAPYQFLLPAMCQTPCAAEELIDSYYQYYSEGAGARTYRGVQLAVAATDYIEDLAKATQPLIDSLFADRTSPNTSGVQRYTPDPNSTTYADFFDMQHFFYLAAERGDITQEAYEAWLEAFDLATPYVLLSEEWFSVLGPYGSHYETLSDIDHCGGMSIFIPNPRYDLMGWTEDYHRLGWYRASGLANTGW